MLKYTICSILIFINILHIVVAIIPKNRQDESRSISENSTWGIRRRFEQGRLFINTTKFLGYDKDKNGNLVINKKQAEIVRRIYREFLDGKGANLIARELERARVPNWHGRAKWYESSIRKMLTNEKYMGDALLQKTYTVDFLSKKRADNTGQVPQYYVEDSHPAIIDKEMWEAAQLEMKRRKAYVLQHGIQMFEYASLKKPFAGRVVCGLCGRAFGRRIWNSTDDRLRRVMWQCSAKYEIKGIRVATINILMMGCCIRALLMCCFGREQGLLHGKVAGAAAKRQCAGTIQGETVYRHYN